MPHHGRAVAAALGLQGDLAKQATNVLAKLYDAFVGTDASQIEINPLAVTEDGQLLVLDAKVGFDSNAMFRHRDLAELRDLSEEDPMEIEASKHDLAYIKLDGDIGCMVNGAGLAMATMDIIKLNGAFPANFLDVGGGANKEKVTAAFKIILSDPAVKGILVNIFGGIMRCDIIAEGIIAAAKEVNLSVPLVVRLEGTNVEEGKRILAESGLPIVAANDLGRRGQEDRRAGEGSGVSFPAGEACGRRSRTCWSLSRSLSVSEAATDERDEACLADPRRNSTAPSCQLDPSHADDEGLES
jgi:succinyl-CoA synthetase beta subunit